MSVGPLLNLPLHRVINTWHILMYWHVPTKCLWFKMVQGCNGSRKERLDHKSTPVQYTIWWLRALDLFWIHTLPLPHISPWCISSSLFYNPWKEFSRALWTSWTAWKRVQGGWETRRVESDSFPGISLNMPPFLSVNTDILLFSVWCQNQLNSSTVSIKSILQMAWQSLNCGSRWQHWSSDAGHVGVRLCGGVSWLLCTMEGGNAELKSLFIVEKGIGLSFPLFTFLL